MLMLPIEKKGSYADIHFFFFVSSDNPPNERQLKQAAIYQL